MLCEEYLVNAGFRQILIVNSVEGKKDLDGTRAMDVGHLAAPAHPAEYQQGLTSLQAKDSKEIRLNASRTGGRCSPSSLRPYGKRCRSLKGFWHRA